MNVKRDPRFSPKRDPHVVRVEIAKIGRLAAAVALAPARSGWHSQFSGLVQWDRRQPDTLNAYLVRELPLRSALVQVDRCGR